MSYSHEFIFGIYPYICIVVFILGCLLRADRDPYSWRAKSSQIMSSKSFAIGNNLFHVGIILLFFGHFIGLLMPASWYHAFGLTAGEKQLIAIVAGGIFGLMCFIGASILLYRRLFEPRVRATSSNMDIIILLLIYVQVILGLGSIYFSTQHLDGAEMVNMANWAQHIFMLKPGAAEYIINIGWIFKLHIALGLTLFMLTPFTRLVHVLSAPIWYLTRTGYQIVRKRS